ncbi:DUF1150 family protein [Shimia thalassica]|jgi:hypothetical protein|uniref:Putative small protein n=1 Tax=Shimia thalassica TaxID=1715693 RepID=A0A0P1I243_9RHOB|nr:DUF1150 family protein [Shimia thalassica]PHO05817.1 DUF1150 domain-containing protein [Rhodobacteraceae bacterium 4F10]MBU2942743.1 DUF1150 domain-containing protein [Shimia thalassica]MDO6480180.1 DUF1150 family protein [Shimia thalassica]MDO6484245.1 DUF1150 family protein [Shimia thalassica]MDO6502489.1 DUF1150 family protein [Shimia thalassica]
MYNNYEFEGMDESRVVYVREVPVEDLPEDMQEQAEGADVLYAVCAATDGERLAVVKERNMAFILARQNDFAPVTVH